MPTPDEYGALLNRLAAIEQLVGQLRQENQVLREELEEWR